MEHQNSANRKFTDDLIRGAYMILFFVAARLVAVLVALIALFQFLCTLITGKPNDNARCFGKDLSLYAAEIIQFLSYNTDRKPWPFSPWSTPRPANPKSSKK